VRPAVDEALLVEAYEGFFNCLREPVVHREVFARPVDAGAEAAHLVGDGVAVLVLPLPHTLSESLAAELLAGGFAFGGELTFDHHLRGDAGVVGAGDPD